MRGYLSFRPASMCKLGYQVGLTLNVCLMYNEKYTVWCGGRGSPETAEEGVNASVL